MTMTSTRSWIAATLTVAALGFGWSSTGLAQDQPKDEGLEKLLEKLDAKVKPKDQPSPEKPKESDPKTDKTKESKPDKPDKPATPAPTPVAPRDQEIDQLLESLGQTKDKPTPDDKKPSGGGGSGPEDPAPKPDPSKVDPLKGSENDIDKELLKITGKKEKPKDKGDRKGEENGPMGQVIKEMRDVEERLGKPDTGDETRKRQADILKNLDELIEQMKNAPSQSMAMKMIREGKKPGQPQPGQPGTQPGAMAQGPPPSKPTDPKKAPVPIELAKSIWGQLPPSFREEMGNVMAEHPLPSKADLIKLYYQSLGNKNSNKGD